MTAGLAETALHLYRVALHPELLTSVRQHSVRDGRLRVRAGLLPAGGQWVEVRDDRARPGAALTVVVAPLALELPVEGRLDVRVVGSEGEARVVERSRLDYEGGYTVERPRHYDDWVAHLEHGASDGFQRILHRRGHPENPGRRPFSLLDLRLDGGLLEVYGVEAFPADRSLVLIHGRWRAAEGA